MAGQNHKINDNIRILTWNIRGFTKKKRELLDLIQDEKPDVVCLQESHIKRNTSPKLTGFTYVPMKHMTNKNRGTDIYVKNDINFLQVSQYCNNAETNR